jgi:bifunctional DNA-binding transcriptional regulator/antitoxin component of YhaV-PrlF toxin-antitoxin module
MCRTDSSGRVTDHTLTDALGWSPGDRLTITSTAHAVLVHREPDGTVSLPVKSCITIPAALRRRHHIHTGDRLLLAATPEDDLLAIYPLATVQGALAGQQAGGDPR